MMATHKFGSIVEAALVKMALSIVRLVNTRQPSVAGDVERIVRCVNQNLRHVIPPNRILCTGRQSGNKSEATTKNRQATGPFPQREEASSHIGRPRVATGCVCVMC